MRSRSMLWMVLFVLLLWTGFQFGLLSFLYPPVQAQSVELLTNPLLIDADGDKRPDGWQGLDLQPADHSVCKPDLSKCRFEFRPSGISRMLYQHTVAASVPKGTRITVNVIFSFHQVGEGSYVQLIGFNGYEITTQYLYLLPQRQMTHERVTISGVVGEGGANQFLLVYRITGGKVKLHETHLTIE